MKFESVYFLDIPKTGSTIFDFVILNSLNSKINILSPKDSHSGWVKEISDKTYIISIIRNPVEHFCSWFVQFPHYEGSEWFKMFGPLPEDLEQIKEKMFFYLKHPFNKKTINVQSSYILNQFGVNDPIAFRFGLLKERLNKINLLLTTDFLETKNFNAISGKICSDLGIDYIDPLFDKEFNFRGSKSRDLYNMLTDDEKQSISKILILDEFAYSVAKERCKEII